MKVFIKIFVLGWLFFLFVAAESMTLGGVKDYSCDVVLSQMQSIMCTYVHGNEATLGSICGGISLALIIAIIVFPKLKN